MFSDYVNSTNTTKSPSGTEAPVLFKPSPSPKDYERGFIQRYFAQKKTDSRQIFEINRRQFKTHSQAYRGLNNKVYEVFSIDWKITGPKNDIYKGKVPVLNGVKDTNENILELEEERHPGISRYLDDPLEFWENRD